MSLYNIVKEGIYHNKVVKQSGGFNGIPVAFPRLAEYIPQIEKGMSIGVLGATGSGKSRFTRWMFLYTAYKFYKETGYPIKIIYLPLEDDKEKVYRNIICHYLYDLYHIYVNLQELDSKGKRILPDFVQEKIDEAEEFFKEFEQIVTVVDGLNEPTQIFEYCQQYALATGHVEKYMLEVDGVKKEQRRYVADNDVHTIIIVDNMSNIDVETGSASEREAMVKFCKHYVRGRLCNFFKFTVVQVLQQDFASERQSFDRDGHTVVAKLEPSLAAIGESKVVSRSMHVVLGLFHPARFKMMQYPIPPKREPDKTYRLDILGNRFRSLSILKANDSDFGMSIAFDFNAVSESMRELPPIGSEELQALYHKIKNKNHQRFTPIKQGALISEEEEDPF